MDALEYSIRTGGNTRASISNSGTFTINTPSSGTALNVTNAAGSYVFNAGSGSTNLQIGESVGLIAPGWNLVSNSTSPLAIGNILNADVRFYTNSVLRGLWGTAHGSSLQATDDAGNLQTVGWRDLPQTAPGATYTLILADRGKHVLLSGTTNTVTIPANSGTAFPVGSTIVLVNTGSGNTTLNITTDTLNWYQGGTNSTGTRTIATASVVTLIKTSSTAWVLTGSGIS
jgi:hypothetical protein